MSGILLAIILLNLALALKAADWAPGLGLLAPVVLGGFLLGTAVSFSRWGGLLLIMHGLITGITWVLIWVSRAPQVPVELQGAERVAFVGKSFYEWLLLLFGDQPARSNLVFILEMAVLCWWLSYLAAWALFREGKVWRATLPVGLVMVVNLYYGPASLRFFLAIYVICALLLAIRTYLAERELNWRYDHVRYATDIQFDFLRDGFLFAVLVVVLALLAPSAASSGIWASAIEPLRESWRQVQEEWARLFSSLNYQATGVRPAFGNTLTLGGPRNLGDTVIMDVRASAGRYWRAVTYDTYEDNRWLNSGRELQAIDLTTHVRTPTFAARREVTQTIIVYYPTGGVLFAAPQPLRVSLKALAQINVIQPATDDGPPLAEITMLRRRGPELKPGEAYLVVSAISTAYVEDLREASTQYPKWVAERYLNVPATVSPRVAELARQVTAGAETPYDKAVALEQFLRTYTYNEKIAAPPPGDDGVDYFLFDVRAGYCDYYATAFVIMARTLGIPARLSAGYNQGEYIAETGVYRVRERNGHSWPEVFFPGYGWIEFEPTASEEPLKRPNRPQDSAKGVQNRPTPPAEGEFDKEHFGQDPTLGPDTQSPELLRQSGWWLGLAGMMLLVVAAAFVVVRPSSRRARRLMLDPRLPGRLYGRLVQWAGRLGLALLPSQTPNEHAAVLAGEVPEGRMAVYTITDFYVCEQYSPHKPGEREAREALSAWTGLQPVLRRHWLRRKLSAISRFWRRPRRFQPPPTNATNIQTRSQVGWE